MLFGKDAGLQQAIDGEVFRRIVIAVEGYVPGGLPVTDVGMVAYVFHAAGPERVRL